MINNMVSVIIANFNNERYLTQCLDSVINQTYKNIEVVVADDCSTDASRDLLKKYTEKYSNIKVVYNQINVGVTQNRINAIQASRGEFITTLDADDYYIDQDKLYNEMSLIGKHRNTYNHEIIAYSNTALVSESGETLDLFYKKDIYPEGKILEGIYSRAVIIPRDFIMSRAVYDRIGGYDMKIPIYEDYDLDIRLAYELEFYCTGSMGTAYRQNIVGLSSAKMKKHYKWQLYIIKKNRKLLTDDLIYRSFRNKLYKALTLCYVRKYKITAGMYRFVRKNII